MPNDPWFNLFESEIEYEIEHGQVNDIHVREGSQRLPPLPPQYAHSRSHLGNGYILVKWNLKYIHRDGIPADWFRLRLYRPKGSYENPQVDPDTIPNPPAGGHEILREDEVGHLPAFEDSDLWNHYVRDNWELVPGDHYNVKCSTMDWSHEERDDLWTGDDLSTRAIHHLKNTENYFVPPCAPRNPIPLKVSARLPTSDTKILAVLAIKRKGRLRLYAHPLKIKVQLPSGSCQRCQCGLVFLYIMMSMVLLVAAMALL